MADEESAPGFLGRVKQLLHRIVSPRQEVLGQDVPQSDTTLPLRERLVVWRENRVSRTQYRVTPVNTLGTARQQNVLPTKAERAGTSLQGQHGIEKPVGYDADKTRGAAIPRQSERGAKNRGKGLGY